MFYTVLGVVDEVLFLKVTIHSFIHSLIHSPVDVATHVAHLVSSVESSLLVSLRDAVLLCCCAARRDAAGRESRAVGPADAASSDHGVSLTLAGC